MKESKFDELWDFNLLTYQALPWGEIKNDKEYIHRMYVDTRYSRHHKKLIQYRGYGYFSLWAMFIDTKQDINPNVAIGKELYVLAPAITFLKAVNVLPKDSFSFEQEQIYLIEFRRVTRQKIIITKISVVDRETCPMSPPTQLYNPDRVKELLDSDEFREINRRNQENVL